MARRPPFTGLIAKLLRSGQGAMTETGPTHPRSIRTCYPQKATYIDTVMNWSDCEVIERDPNKVSGAWVFIGTRVPVSALFDNLDSGATVNEFLDWFPGVTREQVDAVLSFASKSLATA